MKSIYTADMITNMIFDWRNMKFLTYWIFIVFILFSQSCVVIEGPALHKMSKDHSTPSKLVYIGQNDLDDLLPDNFHKDFRHKLESNGIRVSNIRYSYVDYIISVKAHSESNDLLTAFTFTCLITLGIIPSYGYEETKVVLEVRNTTPPYNVIKFEEKQKFNFYCHLLLIPFGLYNATHTPHDIDKRILKDLQISEEIFAENLANKVINYLSENQ